MLAEVFAWLRPNDLIWNYWVNNYLLGKKPPAFDVLYWNADTTRMPAALHRDFLDLSLENTLVTPGEATARGEPVDLGKITTDAYVVAGVADHITPWQSCYKTTRLLGGKTAFVLSTSGHIAALVNPPTNLKASFQTSTQNLVGFQNSVTGLDLGFYAARSYSLMRPPRTGRRLIRSWEGSATGWSRRGGWRCRLRWSRRPL